MLRLEAWLYDRAEVLLGLFNGVFLGLLLALSLGWRDTTAQAKWWEVASALGTLFAALIALWIWVHGQVASRSADLNRGRVAAAILRAPFLGVGISSADGGSALEKRPDLFVPPNGDRASWNNTLMTWRQKISDRSLRDVAPLLEDGEALFEVIVKIDTLIGALGAKCTGPESALGLVPLAREVAVKSRAVADDCHRLTLRAK